MIAKMVCAGSDCFKELYEHDDDEFLVGVDGGALSIIASGYRPQFALGDFDSGNLAEIASYCDLIKIYPSRKDYGDLELAVMEISKFNPEKIFIYNATGDRLDHFLATVNVLVKYPKLNIEILDCRNSIKLLVKDALISKTNYKYLSLFALEDETIISLKGFKYNLENYHLARFDNLCLSNETDCDGKISTNKKLLLVQTL